MPPAAIALAIVGAEASAATLAFVTFAVSVVEGIVGSLALDFVGKPLALPSSSSEIVK